MKALIFIPKYYSIGSSLVNGFEELGHTAKIYDYYDFFPNWKNKLIQKTAGFSDKYVGLWRPSYLNAINNYYLKIINNEAPDLIIIYNNQYFYPETLNTIKKKTKIIFQLGDNPLYSKTFDFNLTILFQADWVISPDSFWTGQLQKIGLKNIYNDVVGYDKRINYEINKTNSNRDIDFIFIGRNYSDSAGFKRALFYSKFSELNFKLYGSPEWLKWLRFFPELKKNLILKETAFTLNEINDLMNRAKIYPIENNVGLFNGIHIRLFDCIGAGVMPLPEWSEDIDLYFKNIFVPSIKNYDEAKEIAFNYISDDNKRSNVIKELQLYINSNYLPKHYIQRLLSKLL